MSTDTTDTTRSLRLVDDTQAAGILREEVRVLAADLGIGRGALIPLLRDLKNKKGHIPSPAIDEIAHTLRMDYAKVHSVASFYSLLDRVDRTLPLAS